MSAAVETAAPTPSCLTSHHPGFTPGAAATHGRAPPPPNDGDTPVPWLNPYNPTTSSKSNKLRGEGLTMGVFSSLSAEDAPDRVEGDAWSWGVKGKMQNGSRPSNQVGEPSPFHQEAEKGLRGQGGLALLLLLSSPRPTIPSYVKWSKTAQNIYLGPKPT